MKKDLCADGEDQQKLQPKMRACLICKKTFPSEWAGERICRNCKSTAAWRSGG